MKGFQDLYEFIQAHPLAMGYAQRKWVEVGPFDIYVRLAHHRYLRSATYEDSTPTRTLDIANISNDDPGRGKFKVLLPQIERAVAMSEWSRAIFFESVINDRFAGFLLRQGYERQVGSTPPSFFKLIQFANSNTQPTGIHHVA